MKKYLFLAALMVIGLSSCSSEHEDAMADDITEADAFVASEQFQEYQLAQRMYWNELRDSLKKLNREEKKMYVNLLDSASHTADIYLHDRLVAQLSQLVGIDYNKRFALLLEARNKAFQNVSIPQEEYLKAVQRYNIKMASYQLTRSDSESACVSNCYLIFQMAAGLCESAKIEGWSFEPDYTSWYELDPDERPTILPESYINWCEYRACLMNAEMEFDSCKSGC